MALINCKECGAQVSNTAGKCPSCGAKIKKPTSVVTWVIAGILGFSFISAIVGGGNNSNSTASIAGSGEAPAPVLDPKEQAISDLKFDYDWHKGGFDSVMLLNAKFKNNGKKGVKDIEITCEHYASSGTKIDSNREVIYIAIPAGKTKTAKDIGMGFIRSQTESSGCMVTDLVVAE